MTQQYGEVPLEKLPKPVPFDDSNCRFEILSVISYGCPILVLHYCKSTYQTQVTCN
jgi:hypothetical protein